MNGLGWRGLVDGLTVEDDGTFVCGSKGKREGAMMGIFVGILDFVKKGVVDPGKGLGNAEEKELGRMVKVGNCE